MGVAAQQAPLGGWGPRPPQKIGHRSQFAGQLPSRNQVLQKTRMKPPPTNKGQKPAFKGVHAHFGARMQNFTLNT